MPTVRHLAGRLLTRRERKPSPELRTVNAEAPQTIGELRSSGLAVVSSVGYGIYCIDLNGKLDLATACLLDTAVAAIQAPDPTGRAEPDLVILDLADVTCLDAVGVAALSRAHDVVRGRAEVRIDLPVHPGPRSMLTVAADHGWLTPVFRPDHEAAPRRRLRSPAR